MIVAVAGRLIDADGASPARFPVGSVDRVAREIEATIRDANAVVSSAACGTDLLAADAAARLGIRARIVLPFDADRFRDTSVIGRGGDWGPLFDRVLTRAWAAGDLVVLAEPDSHEGYLAATREILHQADAIAVASGDAKRLALVVWEGASRGERDLTALFLLEAGSRPGWTTTQIRTI